MRTLTIANSSELTKDMEVARLEYPFVSSSFFVLSVTETDYSTYVRFGYNAGDFNGSWEESFSHNGGEFVVMDKSVLY